MKTIYQLLILFLLPCLYISCNSNPEKKTKPIVVETNKKEIEVNNNNIHQQKQELEFVEYNDDGDYFLLIAKKGGKTTSFINDNTDDRSLLRGDKVEITWQNKTIYIAGDGDTPEQAESIVSIKKIADGNVSKFRKNYEKKLKYNWVGENEYSGGYLDKLYLVVEYYIANSKNELLRLQVDRKDDLTYSIEQQTRGDKEYTVLGIATESERATNTIQWLYFENATQILYEYDLPNDRLVEFK